MMMMMMMITSLVFNHPLLLNMAGEEDEDGYVASRRLDLKTKERKEGEVRWSERCIGFWQKDVKGRDSKSQQICNGINIIHIYNKAFNESKVAFSKTRGIEIIVEDAETTKKFQADEDLGSDGMISHQAPKVKKPKNNEIKDQPTLMDNMAENFKAKYLNINKRIQKYQDDPASMKELWTELQDATQRQFETGKRILTYAKPAEKLTQINTMVQQHYKDIMNWFDGKNGNG